MKKLLLAGLLALSAFTYNARALDLELALCIDASGSIVNSDYTFQTASYATALNTLLPTDGSVAIGVWQFGATVVQVLAPTVVTAVNKASIIATISAMTRAAVNTGATAIGDAITMASGAFETANLGGAKRLVDVSTDGQNNSGEDPATASANAIADGTTAVNGLGIGAAAPATTPAWVQGTGAFYDKIANFSEFDLAIESKLKKEIQGTPEVGSSLALLLMGLVGLGVARRTRKA
jgi:hypothetical protein